MKTRMPKYLASEAALENSQEALRIHSAHGYSKELRIGLYDGDAPCSAWVKSPTRSSGAPSPGSRWREG
jgi:alkylation response protein AidB-like acyl-CoA dehydrogenase